MIRANDPKLKSWIPVKEDSDFPIQNLPLGIIKRNGTHRVASRIGEYAVDLAEMNRHLSLIPI